MPDSNQPLTESRYLYKLHTFNKHFDKYTCVFIAGTQFHEFYKEPGLVFISLCDHWNRSHNVKRGICNYMFT